MHNFSNFFVRSFTVPLCNLLEINITFEVFEASSKQSSNSMLNILTDFFHQFFQKDFPLSIKIKF